jgi:hypothetical protein
MIDSVVDMITSLPTAGKYILVLLLLSIGYSLVKKLVKVALMITILLILVIAIRVLWIKVGI